MKAERRARAAHRRRRRHRPRRGGTRCCGAGAAVMLVGRSAARLSAQARALARSHGSHARGLARGRSAAQRLHRRRGGALRRRATPTWSCMPPACPPSGRLQSLAPRDLQRVLHTNLLAPMLLTQALLPHLRSQPRAQVMFVGSALGRHRPARLQRLQREQVRPARLRRGAAARTRRHRACACRYLGPRSTRTAFNDAGGRGLQPRHRHRDGRARRSWPTRCCACCESDGAPSASSAFPRRWPCASTAAGADLARRARSRATADACSRSSRLPHHLPTRALPHEPDSPTLCPRAPRPAGGGLAPCSPSPGRRACALPPSTRPSPSCSASGKSIRYQSAGRRAREALRGTGRQGAHRSARRSRPQRAAGVGRHHRQLAGPAKRADSARLSLAKQAKAAVRSGDPDRRQRAGRLGLQQPGRSVLQGAAAGRSASATRPRRRSCCRRRLPSTRRASTPTSSTASTCSRRAGRRSGGSTSNARCRHRRAPAASSPTPAGATKRARCSRRRATRSSAAASTAGPRVDQRAVSLGAAATATGALAASRALARATISG